MDKEQPTPNYPEMSDVSFEDAVSILLGVPPEGEEITIYEDEEE